MEVSVALAGSVTIACIVVLGIFVYPWLLARRGGAIAVAAASLGLTLLYFAFQREGSVAARLVFAALWALAPVLAALIVRRIGRAN